MITLKTGLYIVTWDKEDEMRKAVARQCYQCTITECEILDECSYSVKKTTKKKKVVKYRAITQSYQTKVHGMKDISQMPSVLTLIILQSNLKP